MAATKPLEIQTSAQPDSWQGFRPGLWTKEINVRYFIQQNYEPYDGDASFLKPATARTKRVWDKLQALFIEERKRGVLDVSPIPGSITAHPPGYIDRDDEIIVGLQTDAPLKRAIMPNGGFRLVVSALKASGSEAAPHVVEPFPQYRKTPNDAVFDAYTSDVRKCRSSHILTGLPDAYGRGRIIGDYRRVALYGTKRLIEHKKGEKNSLDQEPSSDAIIRDREELAEQVRQNDKAIEAYEAGLTIAPRDVTFHSNLGFLYAEQGNREKGIEHNLAVLDSRPNDLASIRNLAVLYSEIGDVDNALVFAQRALGLVTTDEDKAALQSLIDQLQAQRGG